MFSIQPDKNWWDFSISSSVGSFDIISSSSSSSSSSSKYVVQRHNTCVKGYILQNGTSKHVWTPGVTVTLDSVINNAKWSSGTEIWPLPYKCFSISEYVWMLTGHVDWTHLAHDRHHCQVLVKTLVKVHISWGAINFLTTWVVISYLKRAILH